VPSVQRQVSYSGDQMAPPRCGEDARLDGADRRRPFAGAQQTMTKSCSKEKTPEELHEWIIRGECTGVAVDELRFKFWIKKIFHETEGSIDRVTGQLFAFTEEWDKPPENIGRKAISWTSRLMTCTPAARRF
jgi:hypothetical protein